MLIIHTEREEEDDEEVSLPEVLPVEHLTQHKDLLDWLERKGPNGVDSKPSKSDKSDDGQFIGGFRLL